MSGAVLEVRNVEKTFAKGGDRRGYTALLDVNIEVAEGEFLCLLGPSGCGKTTLLNLMAGFERPTRGSVTYKGREITDPSAERVMCFQDSMQALLPWLSVWSNVAFPLRRQRVPAPQIERRVAAVLDMVGLAADARKQPTELSGGMRQRVQLARALVANPAMLLMDEPFAALDAMSRRKMQRELVTIWSQSRTSIVFITHDVEEALLMGDRVALMSRGPGSRIDKLLDLRLPRPRQLDDAGFRGQLAEVEEHFAAQGEL